MHSHHELPVLSDPAYGGIFIVRNLFLIITLLFIILGVSIFLGMSLTHINNSVKVKVATLSTCVHHQDHQCATAIIEGEQAEQINIRNSVHLEAAPNKSYRRELIAGTVIDKQEIEPALSNALDYRIIIELNEAPLGQTQITYAIIIVGEDSAWNLFVTQLKDYVKQ